LEVKDVGETYLVTRDVGDVVPGMARAVTLHAAIDRKNNPFIIPVPLPGSDGRRNPWHQSRAKAVERAETKWVRVVANMALGAYDLYVAEASLPEPEWPAATFEELMEIAFRDRVIRSAEHPVIMQLQGRS
jgi:hypothetical protein